MDELPHFTVVNRVTGSSFSVLPGETILAAAQRNEIQLSYSCLNGTCGICQGHVVEGDWHYPYLPPLGMDPSQIKEEALLCQAVPLTDMVIIAREPEALRHLKRREMVLTVTEHQRVADDVLLLRLAPEDGSRPNYLAGQYLDFLLEDGRRRAFSIANAPETGQDIELHVRAVPGGGYTEFLFTDVQVGSRLRAELPMGTFFLRDRSPRPIICVAGGTGFAPIKAIVEHFIAVGDGRDLHLYWGARNQADLYHDAQARQWASEHDNIHYIPVLSEQDWAGRTGFVHEAVVADFVDLSGHDVYMSGPPALIDAGRKRFQQLGLTRSHLYYDSFEFAPDVAARQPIPLRPSFLKS